MDEAQAPLVGLGFDVHRFEPGRELWLGGILFDAADGLAGHSDGDVVCHALADAMLGAAALGDVGAHFPDTDAAFASVGGGEILTRTLALLGGAGRAVSSCDLTVICERPAIGPRRDEMRARLGASVGLPVERISVKATRPEGLGLVGDGVGCLALAVVV
jgi:2-C-methyl-D-erythritol 2,4-cyclodiphosphate synthase